MYVVVTIPVMITPSRTERPYPARPTVITPTPTPMEATHRVMMMTPSRTEPAYPARPTVITPTPSLMGPIHRRVMMTPSRMRMTTVRNFRSEEEA